MEYSTWGCFEQPVSQAVRSFFFFIFGIFVFVRRAQISQKGPLGRKGVKSFVKLDSARASRLMERNFCTVVPDSISFVLQAVLSAAAAASALPWPECCRSQTFPPRQNVVRYRRLYSVTFLLVLLDYLYEQA